jgi:eukaryotic-like serine/threonine-protein kinase
MNSPGQREQALFEAALPLSAAERAAYLDRACRGDAQLRQRVEALLQSLEEASEFMAEPAAPPPSQIVRASIPVTEKPGDKISHYKLLQQIGEGGCGVVYMAEQTEPIRRRVALKVIKLGMDTKRVIARFEAERQALALMDHPNIARVLDAGATETGRPYFVLELVRGLKITDYCDQNNFSTEQRLDLFVQVCHAIQHAHQKGIIHRDIKPSNILVTVVDGRPVPKVIDFGIAKAIGQQLTDKTLFTAFEQFIGTPAYMSPEQAELSGVDVDTRSDIYALGVLLYELLTGHTPLDPKTLLAAGLDEMRRLIREKDPPRPSTRISTLEGAEQTTVANRRQAEPPKLIHQVRGDLDWIVMKCLEKDRTRRYETANGLALDIEHHLKNEPVTAAAPTTVYRARKFVRRHKVGLAMLAGMVLLLIGGVVVSAWQAVRATRAERRALAEASKSQQVAQFLQDMLEGVGPSVALGQDTKMLRGILDKTVARVGKDLQKQPAVEAELRSTIGGVYWALGEYGLAEAMHTNALAIRRKLFGSENLDVATSLDSLTLALWSQGRLPEAEKTEREALAIRKRLRGAEHPEVANSLNNLGVMLRDQGQLEQAEPMLRQALDMERRLLTNNDPHIAETLTALSTLLWHKGNLPEAEQMDRDALAVYRSLRGGDDPEVATALNNLGTVLHNEGKLAEAEKALREAMEMNERLLGHEHADAATSRYNLAGLLWEECKLPEAEKLYRDVLALWAKRPGGPRLDMAHGLNNLGTVLRDEGNLVEAEAVQGEALALYRQLFTNDHFNIAIGLNNLASVLQDKGAVAEAEARFRESSEMFKRLGAGQRASLAKVQDNLAVLLRDQNRLAEAEDLARQTLAMRRELLGNDNPQVAGSLDTLTSVLQRRGNLTEAESVARDCLAIREKKLPDHWRTFDARSVLGGMLCQQQKYAEAEPLLLSGYEGIRSRQERIPAHAKARLQAAVQRLVQFYEATAHPDQAAEWRKKLAELNQAAEKNVAAPKP